MHALQSHPPKTGRKTGRHLGVIVLLAIAASAGALQVQGIPAEQQDRIHFLASHHAEIQREVKMTDTGYTAVTESENPEIVKELHKHVTYMSERLGGGRPVRRWDPAFAAFFEQYEHLKHKIEKTPKGIRIEVTGDTPKSIAAAQKHAEVVSQFVTLGIEAVQQKHEAPAAKK